MRSAGETSRHWIPDVDVFETPNQVRVVVNLPGVDPQRLIKEVTEEVGKLSSTPPTAIELERAQASHEYQFLAGLEQTLGRAIALAGYDVQAGDPNYFPKDLARYRAVTAAQIKDAAAKYLRPTARVVLTISKGRKVVEK